MGDSGWIPGQEDHMEKEMATHSSILVWKIPRMEEPGRLQTMASQKELDTTEQLHFHFIYFKGLTTSPVKPLLFENVWLARKFFMLVFNLYACDEFFVPSFLSSDTLSPDTLKIF